MFTVAFDTSTAATVAGIEGPDGTLEARLEAPPGSHPFHGAQLLPALAGLLEEAGARWQDVGRIGVGSGPGTFTGLRIAAATAEGLRRVVNAPVVAVDSLQALGLPLLRSAVGRPACALLDARRGEVFAAGWGPDGRRRFGPVAAAPGALARLLGDGGWLVAGQPPAPFAEILDEQGIERLPGEDPRNLIGGAALCELAREGEPLDGPALPNYVREPDARRPAA